MKTETGGVLHNSHARMLTPAPVRLLARVARDKVLSLLKGDRSAQKGSAHRDQKQCCSVGRAC